MRPGRDQVRRAPHHGNAMGATGLRSRHRVGNWASLVASAMPRPTGNLPCRAGILAGERSALPPYLCHRSRLMRLPKACQTKLVGRPWFRKSASGSPCLPRAQWCAVSVRGVRTGRAYGLSVWRCRYHRRGQTPPGPDAVVGTHLCPKMQKIGASQSILLQLGFDLSASSCAFLSPAA